MSLPIQSPDGPPLEQLCRELARRADRMDQTGEWPSEQLHLLGEAGVFRWFLGAEWGGFEWNEEQVVNGYLALSQACLTTTFILTQRTGACRRIAGSTNERFKQEVLGDLAVGKAFATVGISHLTTSRRHLSRPVLTAQPDGDGFVIDGFAPWVTGGAHAEWIVTGATICDGDSPTSQQILVAVPMDSPGVEVAPPASLVALSASHTGPVHFHDVRVARQHLLGGPVENVMSSGIGGRAGGHETSTLAVGLASAALGFLQRESEQRGDLVEASRALQQEHRDLKQDLIRIVRGEPLCTNESLRQRANSLVLRSAQAALMAAKGAGYVTGHPAGRWCREALFFLVWSCPQPVASAHLCELAGIAE